MAARQGAGFHHLAKSKTENEIKSDLGGNLTKGGTLTRGGSCLRTGIDEEEDALVEEGATGDCGDAGGVRGERGAGGTEAVEGVVGAKGDGPDDGDVGLEFGAPELGP